MSNCYVTFYSRIPRLKPKEVAWLTHFIEDRPDALSPAELTVWRQARGITDGCEDELWPDFEFEMGVDKEGHVFLDVVSEENGNTDNVCTLFMAFLQKFRPNGYLTLNWAAFGDKPEHDSDGGGAAFITAAKVEHINTGTWLYQKEIAFKMAHRRRR